ncbi:MAG: tRNA(Glu)-specific nuclease WapA [Luteibacter sp.]|uniref:RHS repeat-associated core domain-containing protein n=1 Tax=Luteibacter sp. TaxID=1886636 RepID=UPI00137CB3F0|nr:RHS repeat-associated core domain-containing protein [Luteibacter sp.]KAF1003616.1 MAG: tRNA(Glu)-specific nuclease WapA [Luteibacter sp.]
MHYRIAAVSLLCATASVATHAATKQVTYYYTDPQGTVLATADENGNIIERSDYRPFGEQALGSKQDGPGYTGHVNDSDSNLVYMQQRYYDPSIGRFMSIDPAPLDTSRLHNFARYTYANDNPLSFIDPDGREAELSWSTPYRVTSTIRYTMSGPSLPFNTNDTNLQASRSLSGLVNINGKIVFLTTNAIFVPGSSNQSGTNHVTVVPDTNGVTKSGRAETNKIGGNQVTVGVNGPDRANVYTISHEFGHVAGAGDQYQGGLGVNGKTLSADVPGDPNIMKMLSKDGANEQTLREMIESKSNKNTCSPGVHAANGAC